MMFNDMDTVETMASLLTALEDSEALDTHEQATVERVLNDLFDENPGLDVERIEDLSNDVQKRLRENL